MLSPVLPKQPVTFPCHTCITEPFFFGVRVRRRLWVIGLYLYWRCCHRVCDWRVLSTATHLWNQKTQLFAWQSWKATARVWQVFFFFFPHPWQHTERRPPHTEKKEVRNLMCKHTETTHLGFLLTSRRHLESCRPTSAHTTFLLRTCARSENHAAVEPFENPTLTRLYTMEEPNDKNQGNTL